MVRTVTNAVNAATRGRRLKPLDAFAMQGEQAGVCDADEQEGCSRRG